MTDLQWMARALTLAARGRGLTSPNPMVGAILVRDGVMLAERFHERAGDAHAEAAALVEAGDRARGATLYVTLEPCNHVGRTPPCVDAIIRAGVRRVVSATRDPNPRVKGGERPPSPPRASKSRRPACSGKPARSTGPSSPRSSGNGPTSRSSGP